MKTMILMLSLILSTSALAQQATPKAPEADPHPVISQDSTWAGSMVIIVLGLFLAAAVIGPIVRANMPPAPPDVPLHDMHTDADDDQPHGAGHGDAHGGGHGH